MDTAINVQDLSKVKYFLEFEIVYLEMERANNAST